MIRYRRLMSLVLAQPLDREAAGAVQLALGMSAVGRFDDDQDQILGRRTETWDGVHIRMHLSRRSTDGPWSVEVLVDPKPSPAREAAIETWVEQSLASVGIAVDHVFRPEGGA